MLGCLRSCQKKTLIFLIIICMRYLGYILGLITGPDQTSPTLPEAAPKGKAPENPKSGPDLTRKLGKDGKLTPQERQRHMDNSLCLFCGKMGHIAKECPKSTTITAQARATIAELQEPFVKEAKKRLSSLQHPAPPGGCISPICAQTTITLNASITTPDTLIIPVTSKLIPDTPLMSLMDSRSSDLFIDLGFVEKHHLAAYTIPAIRLCLIDGTCNSIITQAIKLHIHFSSGKKQHMNFYVTPLDSSCTLVLSYHWLN